MILGAKHLAFVFLGVATSTGALAQSAPPDLQPKLTAGPASGRAVDQKEQPRLQEPPRQPVAPESIMNAPPAAPAPAR